MTQAANFTPGSRALGMATVQWRVCLLGGGLALALSAVALRGVLLCLYPHPLTLSAAGVQRWRHVDLRAPRGDILDRNGHRLATSVDTPTVVADPSEIKKEDRETLAKEVAEALSLPVKEVLEKLRRPGRYVRIKSRVHPDEARKISELGHRALWSYREPHRFYPEQSLASQILGFVDGTGRGRGGVESSFDRMLSGGSIVAMRRRDRKGYHVEPEQIEQSTHHGQTVQLTIDRSIQRAAERALEGVMERSEPHSAYITVVDVKTGDILAMANAPTFNANAIGSDVSAQKNHAVQDAIEPGSVFKPFTIATALEEGVVKKNSLINCEGGSWRVRRTRIRDDHPHKIIPLSDVIKFSSNIGSAKIALKVGPERFLQYMADFGFSKKTGLQLPGERRGRMRSADRIRPIELATTSYGQGVTSTQIQLVMATAAIANGGLLMRPRLVSQVLDRDGLPVWEQEPEVVRRVVSEKNARAVADMMVTVTSDGGTGTRARVPGYVVAGKTGTAEKVKDGRYSAARIGSFLGFLPANDPKVAIVVTVDEPTKGSRYGGSVAGPPFAELGAHIMRYYGIEPTESVKTVLSSTVVADAQPILIPWTGNSWVMPDLSGRTMRESLASLQNLGLQIELNGSGRLNGQRPPPGVPLYKGSPVSLDFSMSIPPNHP